MVSICNFIFTFGMNVLTPIFSTNFSVAMNPIDVLRTRYYNQPWKDGVGVLYKSGWDAANTVVHNEGWLALYKGFTTHFLRIGPHFCLTFVFLGILRRGLLDFYEQMDGKYETQKGDVLIPQRKR